MNEMNNAYFGRRSSGLRREFRAVDVFIFNVLAFAVGVSLVITPQLLGGLYPRANVWLVLGLGLGLSIFNGVTYGMLAAAMPRSGGDYVFISRSLASSIGFTASFGLVVSQLYGIGLYASTCLRDAVLPALGIMGQVARLTWFEKWAEKLAGRGPSIAVGILLLALIYVVSVRGIRTLRLILKALFVIAVAGIVVMGLLFLGADHASFVARFDAFMAQQANLNDAYNSILKLASQKGFAGGTSWSLWDSLLALPIGYLAFAGFTWSVYIGDEVVSPQRSQVWGILVALFFGTGAYIFVLWGYYQTVGAEFTNALAFLGDANPVPFGGSLLFVANLLTDNVVLRALMCLGFIIWFCLLLCVMIQAIIRVLFAWSMDRFAPEWLTKVDTSTAAPYVSTRVVLFLSLFFMIAQVLYQIGFVNYIALFSFCFLISGIGAFVFPTRNKELFDRSPPWVKKKVGGVYLLRIAAVGNTILFVIILLSALFHRGISGVQEGIAPWIWLVAIYGAGLTWYWVWARRPGAIDQKILHENLPAGSENFAIPDWAVERGREKGEARKEND